MRILGMNYARSTLGNRKGVNILQRNRSIPKKGGKRGVDGISHIRKRHLLKQKPGSPISRAEEKGFNFKKEVIKKWNRCPTAWEEHQESSNV